MISSGSHIDSAQAYALITSVLLPLLLFAINVVYRYMTTNRVDSFVLTANMSSVALVFTIFVRTHSWWVGFMILGVSCVLICQLFMHQRNIPRQRQAIQRKLRDAYVGEADKRDEVVDTFATAAENFLEVDCDPDGLITGTSRRNQREVFSALIAGSGLFRPIESGELIIDQVVHPGVAKLYRWAVSMPAFALLIITMVITAIYSS